VAWIVGLVSIGAEGKEHSTDGTVNLFGHARNDLRNGAGHADRHAAAATPLTSAHT